MPTCQRCNGEGYETWDEDGRIVRDACYHCATTGQVDQETAFYDKLMNVADTLAYVQEHDYRLACDDDPEGEGYDFRAAENMMITSDYFYSRVWDRQYVIAEQLADMPREAQELLIAWNELPVEPYTPPQAPAMTIPSFGHIHIDYTIHDEDDIPF